MAELEALPPAWLRAATELSRQSRDVGCIRQNGDIFKIGLPMIDRKVVTLWVVDEQRDAVMQLKDQLEVFPDSETHVIKNSKYGPSFPYYEGSDVRAAVELRGGHSLLMPRLALCVVNSLYSERIAVSQAMESLPIGNKVLLMQSAICSGCCDGAA